MGFYAITTTTFNGSETSFNLADGSVPLMSVTTDPYNTTNVTDPDEARVSQFMAAVWPETKEYQLPWRGYSAFVDPSVPNDIGFYSWWSMPTVSWFKHFGYGTYLQSMKYGLGQVNVVAPTPPSGPSVTTPQALTWEATVDLQAFAPECSFYDFNWVTLFQLQPTFDPTQEGNTVIPANISTVSNPNGGALKAVVVQGIAGSAGPTVYPGGGVVYNTVRILRLAPVTAGAYAFTFAISYTNGGEALSVNATLNLTIT
jgi:hypothetical protein